MYIVSTIYTQHPLLHPLLHASKSIWHWSLPSRRGGYSHQDGSSSWELLFAHPDFAKIQILKNQWGPGWHDGMMGENSMLEKHGPSDNEHLHHHHHHRWWYFMGNFPWSSVHLSAKCFKTCLTPCGNRSLTSFMTQVQGETPYLRHRVGNHSSPSRMLWRAYSSWSAGPGLSDVSDDDGWCRMRCWNCETSKGHTTHHSANTWTVIRCEVDIIELGSCG